MDDCFPPVARRQRVQNTGGWQQICYCDGKKDSRTAFYFANTKNNDWKGGVDEKTKNLIQDTAIKAFTVLCCEGLSRVDFFLKENGEVYVNEINTMPGFTKISMYPKLWEAPASPSLNGNAGGISYTDLITRLIELGIDRFEKERKLKTVYE